VLAVTLAVGCFEDSGPSATSNDGTAIDTGTTQAPSSATDTGPDADTEPAATTGSSTDDTVDDTGTESSSTGEPLPIQCEDGVVAPGELCFGDTTVETANDATFAARIGDVSGTSSRDLVHLIPDQVVVRAGDGHGGFGSAVFDASVMARHLALEDFDGDGELDLAVPEQSGTLRLLRGSGAGSFTPSAQVVTGPNPQALAVGDVDGDGALDVVVAAGTDVHVVLGDGAGGLALGPMLTDSGLVTGLALADVDGDGLLDLAIAADGGDWQGVALRRGTGGGSFGEQEPTAGQMTGALGVAAGDLDGDGQIDLAYVSADQDALGVLLNEGASFPAELVSATGPEPQVLLAEDLDSDDRVELVVGHRGESTLRIFVLEPGGEVVEGLQVPLAAAVSSLHAGDVNGDGVPDLAATSTQAEIVTVVLSTP